MIVICGRRTARIKTFNENHQSCPNCKALDLEVYVFRQYFHIFLIPVFPTGVKSSRIRCNECGEYVRIDSVGWQYEKKSKTPFYFYSLTIILSAFILLLVFMNLRAQKEKAELVNKPVVGDVYLIRNDNNNSTSYYFLKLAKINGDTVTVYHSYLEYNGFVTKMSDEDFFVKKEVILFSKDDLKQMYKREEINFVKRTYNEESGFYRLK